jgi:peptide/nickel transport system ATP-binding protein
MIGSGTAAALSNDLVAKVSGLSVSYRSGGRDVPVLREVDLGLTAGEALAVVGESGCGKSTLAGVLVGHLRRGSLVTGGTVRVGGVDILGGSARTVRQLRRGQVGLVPQNAGHALTPSLRVGNQVVEVLRTTQGMTAKAARERAVELFAGVRLPQPEVLIDRYPHQLSGGQQQRVAVAVALAGTPRLLVLDEPTTGLDVVTQAGLLALVNHLRAELGLAVVLISHDLGAVAAVADRVAVMYAGRVVERGRTDPTFTRPAHPYTRGLLASVPRLTTPGLPAALLGTVGDAAELPGCAFAPRCTFVQPECTTGDAPALVAVPETDVPGVAVSTPAVSTPAVSGPAMPDTVAPDTTAPDQVVYGVAMLDPAASDRAVLNPAVPDPAATNPVVPGAVVPNPTVRGATVPDLALSDTAAPDPVVPGAVVSDPAVRGAAVPDPVPDPVPDTGMPGAEHRSACLRVSDVLSSADVTAEVRPRERREPGRPLLRVRGLEVDYRRRSDGVSGATVSDVDITVRGGEVVALVGESGSGKSTIAWTIAGLRTPSAGEISLGDADLTAPAARREPAVRRQVQLVFQNAATALNPRRTVGDAVSRPLRLRGLRRAAAREARDEVLADVALTAEHADRLPAALSGGQQQRVGIARALAAGPTLVLADEVTSALDVSVQAAVLRLLDDLRAEHDLGYLFISHDLAVVRGIADRVVVLYLGRVCEEGPVDRVFAECAHPYTRLLVSSVLATEPGADRPAPPPDDEPETAPPATGCAFRGRCPLRVDSLCDKETPPWQELSDGHRVRCHVPVGTS